MSNIRIQKIGITKLDVDAVVNAANSGLWQGGGVCGAIFAEAGADKLAEACAQYGHCDVGSAVITPGFKLKAKYIIHAVGPRWIDGEHGEPSQLYDAYRSSLELAKQNDCHSIGFPLISSGIFGYPKDRAWRKAIRACVNFIEKNLDYDIDIVFAVLDDFVMTIGQNILAEITDEVGIGADKTGARKYSAAEFNMPDELDRNVEKFCRENINLLRAIDRDNSIKTWFMNYSAYTHNEGYEGLVGLVNEELCNRAYSDGIIIKNYSEVIDKTGIEIRNIWEPTKEWVSTLDKIQIIACIAHHYRADHFAEGSQFRDSIGNGLLIPFFETYIEKCE